MFDRRINLLAVLVAAVPYVLLGYPWFSVFRDPWFEGGGLTVEQLVNGPSLAVAFTVAIVSSLVMAYVLALLVIRTGEQTAARGMRMGALVWLGFVATLLGTQYVFEARSVAYFFITSGYPLLGLLIMGAVVGGWRRRAE